MILKNIVKYCLVLVITQFFGQQKFFEFTYKNKVGIVDENGIEVVEPIYGWTQYVINKNSDFIALNSRNIGAIIINKNTGKQEKFDFLAGAMLLEFDNKKWIHGNDKGKSYIIDNNDSEIRKELPTFYEELWHRNPYLIGFKKYSEYKSPTFVDIIEQNTFKIIKKDLLLTDIYDYTLEGGKSVYVVEQPKNMLVFDENFKEIGKLNRVVKVENLIKEISKRLKLDLHEPSYDTQSTVITTAFDYPRVDAKLSNDDELIFFLKFVDNNTQNLFKVKRKKYRFSAGSIDDQIEIDIKNEKSSLIFKEAQFYLHPKTYKILFPEEYWAEIGISLINN